MADAVLLPVYNEAETVCAVLDAVRSRFGGEVIVVDDGSTDRTSVLLAARDDVTVIAHPANLGYGRALSEGFAVSRARGIERLVTMDCDGQHEPKHIPEFLDALSADDDVISGSRYLPESAAVGTPTPDRRAVNLKVTREINRSTGWNLTDAFCGFKAYRLRALDRIELREPGYAMPLELWAKAYRAGLRIREVAVERIYHDHDRSFGSALDNPDARLAYYMRVWRAALEED
ncbi:MAG: glycosyltransferase family 2 protein [Coriobacteriia bacterium]|nr:glycosyltransferase family 2 protein [Coriobacteriia bacterium]